MASAVYRPQLAGAPPMVLVVEDEALLRMVISEALRDAGVKVIEAANADEALAVLAAGVVVDVVLTDVRMPGALDGIALAQLLRRERPDIHVVVTSGDLDPDLARQMPTFIAKPYDLEAAVVLILSQLDARAPE